MKRYLLGACALVAACLTSPVDAGSVSKDMPEVTPRSMRFTWHNNGPPEECSPGCHQWVSATGPISEGTAQEFESFASKFELRGATLVIDSEGGSVRGALALGRAIRQLGMTTSVGRTKVSSTTDFGPSRSEIQSDTTCESMCVFILLGVVRRHVPPEAHVEVHQIWIGNKRGRAREASYTAEELELVQRDIGSLARYTVEMGCDIELIETALRIPPWEPLYKLSEIELRNMRVITDATLYDPPVPIATIPMGSPKMVSPNEPVATVQFRRGVD